MTRTISRRRQLMVLLGVILLFCTVLSPMAFAEEYTVSTMGPGYNTAYFQTYSSSGTWSNLGTPKHYIVETGEPCYCIQTSKGEPSNASYYTVDPFSVYSDLRVIRGIHTILENGYPNSTGGFSDDEARYATANAIRFFLADCGDPYVPAWMNLNNNSQFFRARSGYESLWNWCMQLRSLANMQDNIPSSLTFSQGSITLADTGTGYFGSINVSMKNCEGGYYLDTSNLPSGATVTGNNGSDGDTITIFMPYGSEGSSYTFTARAYGTNAVEKIQIYAPYNTSLQNTVAYVGLAIDGYTELDQASFTVNVPEASVPDTATLTFIKLDSMTNEPLEGACFILRDSSTGYFSQVYTEADGRVTIPDIPLGTYQYQEYYAPEGYIADTARHSITFSTAGEDKELTIYNDPEPVTATLEILKTDSVSGEALQDAGYRLYNANGTLIGEAYTNSSGVVTVPDLEVGNYIYQEFAAPEGYKLDSTSYSVTLDGSSETVRETHTNTLIPVVGSISIHKQDAAGNALSGFNFALESSKDNGTTWTNLSETATDINGNVSFTELATGADIKYRVTETKAKPGYALSTEHIYEGTLTDNKDLSFTVCNCPIMVLPFTGGNGFNLIPVIALMLSMGIFYFKRRMMNEIN